MSNIVINLQNISWERLIVTVPRISFILLVAWFGMMLIKNCLLRFERKLIQQGQATGEPPTESAKRVETLLRLIRQGAFLGLWITVTLIILKEVGVEIGPILASAGVLGLAIGFGAQNLVRDVISGFFFILCSHRWHHRRLAPSWLSGRK